MSRVRAALWPVLRVGETLVLSTLSGAFVWVLGQMLYVPLLGSALLGLLAGGTATMATLGAHVASRPRRMALAAAAAVTALLAGRVLSYAAFQREAAGLARAVDYRLTDDQVRRAVDDDLRTTTGRSGPLGHALLVLDNGVRVGPLTLRRTPLLAAALLEATVTLAVATRWAGGPAPLAPGKTGLAPGGEA